MLDAISIPQWYFRGSPVDQSIIYTMLVSTLTPLSYSANVGGASGLVLEEVDWVDVDLDIAAVYIEGKRAIVIVDCNFGPRR